MTELGRVFDHQLNTLERRRKLGARSWKPGETFTDYYPDELVFANKVPVDDDEVIGYIIDDISDHNLRNQPQTHNFHFEAFKQIKLESNPRQRLRRDWDSFRVRSSENRTSKPQPKDGEAQQTTRCFNCNIIGHTLKECQQTKRQQGAGYHCNETGYLLKICPKKKMAQINNVTGDFTSKDDDD